MAAIQPMTRVFKMGSVVLDDPDPTATPLKALRYYAANYPQLAAATLSEPIEEAGRLVYEVEKPPAKTKG